MMAHLIAGLPAFLDFIPLAWASFGGHVIFGLVVGAVVKWRRRRPERRPKPLAQLDRHLRRGPDDCACHSERPLAMATRSAASRRPRVVIVGAGFGGLSAAKALGRAPVEVMVIDRHNYLLFQPLLYQVATAALSPADIAAPIRSVLRHQANTSVMLAKVTGVDMVRQEVVLGARRVPFDFLVLATGARHAYFGHDDWELHAHGIKKIDDATFLRRKILLAFERAESESDPSERRRLLTFVVIGGGAPASRWPAPSPSSPARRSRPISAPSIRVGPGDPARGRPAPAARL